VTVGIKTDAEHDCIAFFLLGRVRHKFKLSVVAMPVKQYQSTGVRLPSKMSTFTEIERFPHRPGFRKIS
jgi:hypothetical protein